MGMEGGREEEQHCNIIYYCASWRQGDVAVGFRRNARPSISSSEPGLAPEEQCEKSLKVIYQNVQKLLDEDQGGFNEGMLGDAV